MTGITANQRAGPCAQLILKENPSHRAFCSLSHASLNLKGRGQALNS